VGLEQPHLGEQLNEGAIPIMKGIMFNGRIKLQYNNESIWKHILPSRNHSCNVYGIILIQPGASLALFGHANSISRGHTVTTILLAMMAMIFTAISYGRMAKRYPAAGSVYTYVGRGLHPHLGFVAVCSQPSRFSTASHFPGMSSGQAHRWRY